MNPAAVLAVLLGATFAALGIAKVAKSASMLERAEHVGFSPEQYQLIGLAEIAGAVGLLVGLFYPPLGYAAAVGLLALLGGALLTHLRLGDGPGAVSPAALFAVGTVGYLLALGAV